MLANGTLVIASESENADLLYALKGGGPFYAAVLEW